MILQNAVKTFAEFYCPERTRCLELWGVIYYLLWWKVAKQDLFSQNSHPEQYDMCLAVGVPLFLSSSRRFILYNKENVCLACQVFGEIGVTAGNLRSKLLSTVLT